jgi:hypothetical protein
MVQRRIELSGQSVIKRLRRIWRGMGIQQIQSGGGRQFMSVLGIINRSLTLSEKVRF